MRHRNFRTSKVHDHITHTYCQDNVEIFEMWSKSFEDLSSEPCYANLHKKILQMNFESNKACVVWQDIKKWQNTRTETEMI